MDLSVYFGYTSLAGIEIEGGEEMKTSIYYQEEVRLINWCIDINCVRSNLKYFGKYLANYIMY